MHYFIYWGFPQQTKSKQIMHHASLNIGCSTANIAFNGNFVELISTYYVIEEKYIFGWSSVQNCF